MTEHFLVTGVAKQMAEVLEGLAEGTIRSLYWLLVLFIGFAFFTALWLCSCRV